MTEEGAEHVGTERTSQLLRKAVANVPDEAISLNELLVHFRRRSFGGLVLVLAIMTLLPGISLFAGLIMLVPGIQMLLAYQSLKLPRFLGERELPTEQVRAGIDKVLPSIEWLERYIKPRWAWAGAQPMPIIIGLVVILLAFVALLPLPFSNIPPALALICISLGVLERDGRLIVAGLFAASVALAIGAMVAGVALEVATSFFDRHF